MRPRASLRIRSIWRHLQAVVGGRMRDHFSGTAAWVQRGNINRQRNLGKHLQRGSGFDAQVLATRQQNRRQSRRCADSSSAQGSRARTGYDASAGGAYASPFEHSSCVLGFLAVVLDLALLVHAPIGSPGIVVDAPPQINAMTVVEDDAR